MAKGKRGAGQAAMMMAVMMRVGGRRKKVKRERAAREMQKVAAVLRASRAWRRTEERVQVRLWLVRVSTDMAESMRSRRSS